MSKRYEWKVKEFCFCRLSECHQNDQFIFIRLFFPSHFQCQIYHIDLFLFFCFLFSSFCCFISCGSLFLFQIRLSQFDLFPFYNQCQQIQQMVYKQFSTLIYYMNNTQSTETHTHTYL